MIGVPGHRLLFADYDGTLDFRDAVFNGLLEFLTKEGVSCWRCASSSFLDSLNRLDSVQCLGGFQVFTDEEFASLQAFLHDDKLMVADLSDPRCFEKVLEVVKL